MFSKILSYLRNRRGAGLEPAALPDAAPRAGLRPRGIVHPFLFAIYPVLSLYAQNVFETPAAELKWPIAAGLGATAAAWLLLKLLVRDGVRAGLVVSLLLILFFTVSQATEAVDYALSELTGLVWVYEPIHVWPPMVVGGEILVVAALGVLAVARLKDPGPATRFANVFAIIVVCFPASHALLALAKEPPRSVPMPAPFATATRPDSRPDIYYIILDGFARADVQRALFDNDIEPLLQRLEAKGFFVARRSVANYGQTPLSLASSLNGAYLNDLFPETALDKSPLRAMIGQGAVVTSLRRLGYRFVTFATGFDETEHPEADDYRSPYPHVSGFHRMLLSGTPLARFLPNPSVWDSYTLTRQRTLYLFDAVPGIARDPAPTFTFAHVLSPHPPFVFGEHGEDVSPHETRYLLTDGNAFRMHYGGPEIYTRGYRRQAIYLAGRVEQMIDRILAESPRPPIIILQSDHGSGLGLDVARIDRTDVWERMSILNAYYFPGRRYAALDEGISPVNSFRVVFNTFFGSRLDLLPNRSYYSPWSLPYDFADVTDRVAQHPRAVSVHK